MWVCWAGQGVRRTGFGAYAGMTGLGGCVINEGKHPQAALESATLLFSRAQAFAGMTGFGAGRRGAVEFDIRGWFFVY